MSDESLHPDRFPRPRSPVPLGLALIALTPFLPLVVFGLYRLTGVTRGGLPAPLAALAALAGLAWPSLCLAGMVLAATVAVRWAVAWSALAPAGQPLWWLQAVRWPHLPPAAPHALERVSPVREAVSLSASARRCRPVRGQSRDRRRCASERVPRYSRQRWPNNRKGALRSVRQ